MKMYDFRHLAPDLSSIRQVLASTLVNHAQPNTWNQVLAPYSSRTAPEVEQLSHPFTGLNISEGKGRQGSLGAYNA